MKFVQLLDEAKDINKEVLKLMGNQFTISKKKPSDITMWKSEYGDGVNVVLQHKKTDTKDSDFNRITNKIAKLEPRFNQLDPNYEQKKTITKKDKDDGHIYVVIGFDEK